jgi:hypothetical protein
MANTFKNSISGSIGTGGSVVYTAPSNAQVTIIGLNVSNIETSNSYVDVRLHDDSTSDAVYIIKNGLIPAGSNIPLVGGDQKIVLEQNDYISVTSSLANSIDAIVSVLEIT